MHQFGLSMRVQPRCGPFTTVSQRLDQLTKQIWDDINANDVVDMQRHTDGGYLSTVVASPTQATERSSPPTVYYPG